MGKVLSILGGLVAMGGGIALIMTIWKQAFLNLVFGCIPIVLFFGGLIAFVAGVSSLKDSSESGSGETEETPSTGG